MRSRAVRTCGFEPPEGVSFVEIDRDTGLLALPTCPRVISEAFFAGTEPLRVLPAARVVGRIVLSCQFSVQITQTARRERTCGRQPDRSRIELITEN